MLKKEDLKQVEGLKDLPEETLELVAKLSENDEEQTMKKRIGEIYRDIDKDFQELTGIEKPGSEKTYKFWPAKLKEAIEGQGGESKELKQKLGEYEVKIKDLEEKVKTAKGDTSALDALKAQLKAERDAKKDLQGKLEETEKGLEEFKFNTRVMQHVNKAVAKYEHKFVDSIPEDLRPKIMKMAVEELLSKKKELVETDQGERLEFYDGDKRINNKDTFEPASVEDLLGKFLGGSIKTGEEAGKGGAGTGGAGGKITKINLQDARNKQEAYQAIDKMLTAQNLVKGSKEYQAKMNEYWQTEAVQSLPFE